MSPQSHTKQDIPGTNKQRAAVPQQEMKPCQDLVTYVQNYARQKPDVAALWCFGIGFVVGWKMKPW